MHSEGAPELYWRVDDDGMDVLALQEATAPAVERARTCCGHTLIVASSYRYEAFRGRDGPASPREMEVIRAANRLVTIHRRCIAIAVAVRG